MFYGLPHEDLNLVLNALIALGTVGACVLSLGLVLRDFFNRKYRKIKVSKYDFIIVKAKDKKEIFPLEANGIRFDINNKYKYEALKIKEGRCLIEGDMPFVFLDTFSKESRKMHIYPFLSLAVVSKFTKGKEEEKDKKQFVDLEFLIKETLKRKKTLDTFSWHKGKTYNARKLKCPSWVLHTEWGSFEIRPSLKAKKLWKYATSFYELKNKNFTEIKNP